MLVLESARISAFAGSLEFDEPDQRAMHSHGIIGTNLQVGQGRFADRDHGARREAAHPCEASQQLLEWSAKLVFRGADGTRIGKLMLGAGAEVGGRGRASVGKEGVGTWR